ncbi:MAG: glucosaminidase domain-containing protein [Treponema sp.]|jgi:hypothetical protein|nr:glucosaminidase domain-containing protein [Treponema sp.]
MKKITASIFLLPLLQILLSCAAGPQVRTEGVPEKEPERPVTELATGPAAVPEQPAPPEVPEYIMGRGMVPARLLADFLISSNPKADRDFTEALAGLYVGEAGIEGVNHDIAFAQMCLETGFLSYGGLVTADMNNFCGLGAIGPERPGERFSDPLTGVRAHIQHLKGYATEEPLKQELVDPRYRWVRYGSSPRISGLAGTWASDKRYAEKINNILERLYIFSFDR